MYLLYLDESGTHSGSPVMVLAGIAVHENDAWKVQRRLDGLLQRMLPSGVNPADFELHAAEIKSPRNKSKKGSNWEAIPLDTRLRVMRAVFSRLKNLEPTQPEHPSALFGAVVDQSFADRELRAYEEVLHKFDEMLMRRSNETGARQHGIVIHDRRVVERDVQGWVNTWRKVAGRIGRLTQQIDVPMFADSRASRLIQAADFVAWGLYRCYGIKDESWIKSLWSRFDAADGTMHGLIHATPNYRHCNCAPCASRHAKGR